jgi:hypothetical protein
VKKFLLLAVMLGCNQPPIPPPVVPPTDASDAAPVPPYDQATAACAHLQALGCPVGRDPNCAATFRLGARFGANPACVLSAPDTAHLAVCNVTCK